ncbi:hypothetical protein [Saccharothrix stipae]
MSGAPDYLADKALSETFGPRREAAAPAVVDGERLGVRETFLDRLFEPHRWPGRRWRPEPTPSGASPGGGRSALAIDRRPRERHASR